MHAEPQPSSSEFIDQVVNRSLVSDLELCADRGAAGVSPHTLPVPISLLHRLAEHDLPIAVNDGADVDALRVLRLAGHVKASIPKPVRTMKGHDQPPATVLAITALGRSMMQRFPRRSSGGHGEGGSNATASAFNPRQAVRPGAASPSAYRYRAVHT